MLRQLHRYTYDSEMNRDHESKIPQKTASARESGDCAVKVRSIAVYYSIALKLFRVNLFAKWLLTQCMPIDKQRIIRIVSTSPILGRGSWIS